MAVRWSLLLTLLSRVVRRRRGQQDDVFGVQWIYRRNGHGEEAA